MKNSQKIAVLCNYELLADRVGGMDYFFWLFDDKCNKNNIQVDWFFPNKASHGNYSNLNIIDCKYDNIEHFYYNYYLKNSQKYNYIITHFIELCSPIFKNIKKLSNAKIIQVDHNPRPINGFPIKKQIERKIKGLLYSKYIDTFIGVSNYSKDFIINDYGNHIKNKCIIVFNGLEIKKFIKKKSDSYKSKFIVASHLRKDKGIQDLIEAIHNLPKEFHDKISIDVFGKGYYQNELEKLIKLYSLSETFNFKGSVSNLYELYQNYDYLVHPSHGETFCFSVVESLICNLPVITTKNQGNVLGLVSENKNGFLFLEKDINSLTDILMRIVENEIVLNDFSTSEEFLQNLTIENMVENYFKLLQ